MRLFRGTFLDTPDDPFRGGVLRAEEDGGLLIDDAGFITARGPFTSLAAGHRDAEVVDLRGGLVLPGFVDTHVHYPQLRCIGALGMPLLEWLERCALPEEARLADPAYAGELARAFVGALANAGTTTALVFGAHYVDATEALFAEADRAGLRITSGLVLSDRDLRDDLHTTPARAYDDALTLAKRWHGVRRNRYAVIPRFALSSTSDLLDACASLLADVPGSILTTHVNENTAEIERVRTRFPEASSYVDTYARHGLLGPGSVLAHNVHPADDDLDVLSAAGAAVAHCPTSNLMLGSGLFPMRAHLDAGVPVALGSDVGAGTGLSLFKEALQAYFVQQAQGGDGVPLTSAHLLHLATTAGASALGLSSTIGTFDEGHAYDALWLCPQAETPLHILLHHATSAEDALAKSFAHATSADVAEVWVAGTAVSQG
jgi:guanine deaminase